MRYDQFRHFISKVSRVAYQGLSTLELNFRG